MLFTVPNGKTYGKTTGEFGETIAKIRAELIQHQPLKMVEATSAWFHKGELFSVYMYGYHRVIRLFDLSKTSSYNFKGKGIGAHYTGPGPCIVAEYQSTDTEKLTTDIHTHITSLNKQFVEKLKPNDHIIYTHYSQDSFGYPTYIPATIIKVLKTKVKIKLQSNNGEGEQTITTKYTNIHKAQEE